MSGKLKSLSERFWSKVDKHGPDECWLWTGAKRKGYGQIRRGGRGSKLDGTHRVSWEIHNGPIPEHLHALHSCDNRPCVNPKHLFLGAKADNMADMVAKGRQDRGEARALAKLNEADVRSIRATYADGGISQRELARFFGVSQGAVLQAINRVTWRHVT